MMLLRDNVCFRLLRNCLADRQNERERSIFLKTKHFWDLKRERKNSVKSMMMTH